MTSCARPRSAPGSSRARTRPSTRRSSRSGAPKTSKRSSVTCSSRSPTRLACEPHRRGSSIPTSSRTCSGRLRAGKIARGPESTHANAGKPSVPNAWHYEWLRGMGTPEPNVLPVARHPGLSDEQRTFLLGRGVRALVSVPVVVDKELVGSFTLHLESEDYPLAEDLELIQTLANQVSLAVRLQRLTEGMREAAVTREREQAATQREQAARARAESLARFGEASRRTLERLASSPHLDAFLGQVITVAVEQFGAIGGSVWEATSDEDTRLIASFEEGELRSAATSRLPALLDGRALAAILFAPEGRRDLMVYDADAFAAGLDDKRLRDDFALHGCTNARQRPDVPARAVPWRARAGPGRRPYADARGGGARAHVRQPGSARHGAHAALAGRASRGGERGAQPPRARHPRHPRARPRGDRPAARGRGDCDSARGDAVTSRSRPRSPATVWSRRAAPSARCARLRWRGAPSETRFAICFGAPARSRRPR